MAHPLAQELARLLERRREASVLMLGIGNGRNLPPLLDAGLMVWAVDDNAQRVAAARRSFPHAANVRILHLPYGNVASLSHRFSAALSTHALLHGTPATAGAIVGVIKEALVEGAYLFATLGSTRDPRCGNGVRIEPNVFASKHGREAGVPHVFFDEVGVRALLDGFVIESLHQRSAADTVGAWAHGAEDARDIVHWFVRARRSACSAGA